ncbi:Eco57I restriction-modification methylase domain-containing protein [Stutzerimonas stutzeri]|jgi:hypothetical protein|uniref:Eco57I restriction-modification methylase domain-containing protein n=1 Tax=Stutzerimonas stutzeri TaxID=316 RepID=UPI00244AAE66|nr:DNA methyltransferase [Stutzerimonas stutzeri]MDH0121158.1 BREX-1 system adenine-specific DNA-methyltransferase PglX [Stutzerimonas stutzeri]HBP6330512.1 SAM-dependent DNA methyltransferase [Pseudomonas aeruginosa]HCI3983488.1 hypothetical protein [Pseudomonas aeruginosa]HEJ3633894.1 hypothetical protein [Pseudomonas aeruginosa]
MTQATHRQPLDKALRRALEATVVKARDIAELAASQALTRLSVGEAKAAEYLNDQQRQLRTRLRAHGRQLGDSKQPNGQQSLNKLITEVAYEHWHRMLFARFLEQNHLLMYDEHTPLTLAECNELAQDPDTARDELERRCNSGWELAGVLASKMLPQIFRIDSPVFALEFAPEHQRELERLVTGLAAETFQAQDSLGWVYQFWQSKRKEEVNRSEVKIGADELSPVTQLFTEPYMVSFLLDNSLGAWWAGQRLTDHDWQTAHSEQELREKAAIPGVPLSYLRFVQNDQIQQWQPASGTFDAWPKRLSELKTLDPCCGSGHFLVAAFLMLVPMRMQSEQLNAQQAIDKVLSENLHGLELDQRCVELAAFAVALEAWRYPEAGGYRSLPRLHIACSGLSISGLQKDWLELAGDNRNLRIALEELYEQFKDAPLLGSLVNPEASLNRGSLFKLDWDEVEPLLVKALENERDDEKSEMGVVAQGIIRASSILSQKYDLVQTNVPYLGISKHDPKLLEFIEKWYEVGKYDLALVFIERIREWLTPGGAYALVSLGEWLYLGPYKKYRVNYLEKHKPLLVMRLGWNAFSSPIRANPALLIASAGDGRENYFSLSDCSANKQLQENLSSAFCGLISRVSLGQIRRNPDLRFIDPNNSEGKLLLEYADARSGLHAGDLNQFFSMFWEVESFSWVWEPIQTAVNFTARFAGREQIIRWERERGSLAALAESVKHLNHAAQNWRAGKPFWGSHGVVVGLMGKASCAIYSGQRYDVNSSVIIPKRGVDLPALWAFCESGIFSEQVRLLDNSLKLAPKTLLKVHFDLSHWAKIAEEQYPNGLPQPYTNDPTQWIFHGHPCGSVIWDEDHKWTAHGELRIEDSVLQVAVARLLGYQWPAELDPDMELAAEQREWVERCQELAGFVDDDGIVCLPPVRGEKAADQRLEALLQAAYGDAWTTPLKNRLLDAVGSKSLSLWLRDKFFEQHCKMFQHRPFVWHIWDGLKDGFSVLVNYHKLDKAGLERLIYTYLGDWIRTQQAGLANGEDGAQERLAAAEALKRELEAILEGEKPYDIFVRWKPLAEQPIGWNPDLNDGVRLNIRPFLYARDVSKKGAGILRWAPNIKWTKDRGKDVESAPWYKLGLAYGEGEGARINDHHLSLAQKRAARSH